MRNQALISPPQLELILFYIGEGSFSIILFNELLPDSIVIIYVFMTNYMSKEVIQYKKKKYITIKNMLLMRYIKILVVQLMIFLKY